MNLKELLELLEDRFKDNMHRHPNLNWDEIKDKVEAKLDIISKMESSSGEVDIFEIEGKIYAIDASKESPLDRRSLCYDQAALDQRTQNKPKGNALNVAKEMGTSLLSENMYYQLQEIEDFDLKSSSWVLTDSDFRSKGGALFCEKRYGRIFTYHNGASSYYSSRGFRTYIEL